MWPRAHDVIKPTKSREQKKNEAEADWPIRARSFALSIDGWRMAKA